MRTEFLCTLGPDATLNTKIYKNSVRIKAPKASYVVLQCQCCSIIRRNNTTSCKSALKPPVVCSTDRSKAVVPVLVLLFVVYSTRRFVACLSVCHFVLVFFSPFSVTITSLGEERANLSAFRTFVRLVLV